MILSYKEYSKKLKKKHQLLLKKEETERFNNLLLFLIEQLKERVMLDKIEFRLWYDLERLNTFKQEKEKIINKFSERGWLMSVVEVPSDHPDDIVLHYDISLTPKDINVN